MAVGLFLEWTKCCRINSTHLNPALAAAKRTIVRLLAQPVIGIFCKKNLVHALFGRLVTLQCITDRVMTEPLFKNVDSCQDMIVEALKYHLLPDRRQLMYSQRTQPRKSYIGQLFAFGANDSGKPLYIG